MAENVSVSLIYNTLNQLGGFIGGLIEDVHRTQARQDDLDNRLDRIEASFVGKEGTAKTVKAGAKSKSKK